ncbi:17-beta-hydroxysteroid dehydrogenase 13-like isoform X1 [Osmia bicornis bicornis]|uniref:17-beta-hydroxysteroid dehydrogenase 13-like isoform X1 n=2 Tax=Osmia bicornis bicornis TaxID=1437191 RepID=UPI0010F7FEA5|nr:17-beta-hydroxysteroid dehydrogenase 13-like isoform X1 [Osmia bicornis bicornis]XP_029048372.1 17-beta-hydroxysteroid dehydrogenase 13-like isoform X1 [Osmia bicornis bicornis]
MESLRRNFRPPKMLLKLYSLFILTLDLVTLLFGIVFAILVTFYRMFRPPPLKSLRGEIAMVVGAGRGVGRELAIHLCQLGVNVACVDINVENCYGTILQTSKGFGVTKAYICDITDKNEVAHTVNNIQSELGEVTMLFHCCSIPSPRALLQDPPEIRHTIDLTVISHFWLLDAVLPCMERVGRGHIVVLSSVAGLSGGATRRSRVPLSTAQFAVQGLAESLHTELRHSNSNIIITLVHVYPFIVGAEVAKDIRFRIPSYFGTMPAAEAAKQILDGVRRNYAEFSVPGYLLYLGHILRILPKKASFMLRDLLDTGVDFG